MDSRRGILYYLKRLVHFGRKAHGVWEKTIDHTENISEKIGGLSETVVESIRNKSGKVRERVDDSIEPALDKLKTGGGKMGHSFFARMGAILRRNSGQRELKSGQKTTEKHPKGESQE